MELRQESKHDIFLLAFQTASCGFVYCPLQLGRNVAGATFNRCLFSVVLAKFNQKEKEHMTGIYEARARTSTGNMWDLWFNSLKKCIQTQLIEGGLIDR